MSLKSRNPIAVIFDMDGLLLDSERIALATFVAACREHSFEPDVDIYLHCIGMTFPKTKEALAAGYGPGFPLEPVCDLWTKKYHEETADKPVPLKTGVADLLRYLENDGVKKAVVTSTRFESAYRKLTNARIAGYFDFIIGGDQITHGKPHPEIYLTACGRLNRTPDECLALEDSDNGVLSATAAGISVIQVPDLLTPSDKVKALGHPIVKTLADVQKMLSDGFSV